MAAGRSGASRSGGHDDRGRSSIERDVTTGGPSTSPLDDRALVAAVLDGDRDAFRRLVERESDALVRACQRILGDHAEAEDAAQEAFVTAYRSLATWRGDGPLGGWLMRIGVRIALRAASRRRTVAWRDPAAGVSIDDRSSAADRVAEREAIAAVALTDPAILSLRAERATEIRSAVIALTEPYRETVALRFFGDSTLEEIARLTGRPLPTVKTHLYRGLERLRQQLDGGGR